jgi:hypothetical protein
LGARGSIVTFIGTTSIIPFLPNGWAHEAGGFPIMTLPLGFLMKDVLFLVDLSSHAGSDACSAGDNTELSDLMIQIARAIHLLTALGAAPRLCFWGEPVFRGDVWCDCLSASAAATVKGNWRDMPESFLYAG